MDLLSDSYFDEACDFIKQRVPHLVVKSKKAYGNCPFCQMKRNRHKMPFGIWTYKGRIYIGCKNDYCSFGTRNNIFDFIRKYELINFPTALEEWRIHLNIKIEKPEPEEKEETLITDGEFLYQCVDEALSGNGRYWTNIAIRTYKELLLEEYSNSYYYDLKMDFYVEMLELLTSGQKINRYYLVQRLANYLRSKAYEAKNLRPFLECEFEKEMTEKPRDLSALDYKNVRYNFRKNVDGFEEDLIVNYEDITAINLADCELTDIEKRVFIDGLTIREAAELAGVSKTTFNDHLNDKLHRIKHTIENY